MPSLSRASRTVRVSLRRFVRRTAPCVIAGAMAIGCITTPPPPVTEIPDQRPAILRDSVTPPPDELLEEWPADDNFVVAVQTGGGANVGDQFDVFVDYVGTAQNQTLAVQPTVVPTPGPDGVSIVNFQVAMPAADPPCHEIRFLVVHGFATRNGIEVDNAPDNVGGDEIDWFYTPGGGLDGCQSYVDDAGAGPDGGADARVDAAGDAGDGASF